MDLVTTIEKIVRIIMPKDDVHGLGHVLRVRKLALEIAKHVDKSVDLEILELAALLHDIGRLQSEKGHAKMSAKVAKSILELIKYPREKIEKVVNAILAHSFSENVRPICIEAQILSDADKLDALGAIGIARVIAYGGSIGRNFCYDLKHFKEKILKLKNLMYTDYGKMLADRKSKIIERFVKEFEEELSEC